MKLTESSQKVAGGYKVSNFPKQPETVRSLENFRCGWAKNDLAIRYHDTEWYVEETIFDLRKIYINGGKRGFLIEIEPSVLSDVLKIETTVVGIKG